MRWFKKNRERRLLILGENRVDLDEHFPCSLCKADLNPVVFTGKQEIGSGLSWFGYKGAACRRCGYPCSSHVIVTDVVGPSREEIWRGKVHLLFKELGDDKAKQYLETLDMVFEAVNLLLKEEKLGEMLPPRVHMETELTESVGVPPWIALEMRKALSGQGSDLLVKILNAARSYVPG